MKKFVFFCTVALLATIGFSSCGNKEVLSIELDKTTLTLNVGSEQVLTATVKPDNATDKSVTWTSSNSAIAKVENGKVTAIAEGTATIAAKAGDKIATCEVTVNPLSSLVGTIWVGEMDGAQLQINFTTATACVMSAIGADSYSGTYTYNQPNISMIFTFTTLSGTVNGNQMIVTDSAGNGTITFTKQ